MFFATHQNAAPFQQCHTVVRRKFPRIDRIVTSGLDGIFPKGILIGVVGHVTRGNRGLMQLAEVKPSVPLDRLEEVMVVRSAPQVLP